MILDYSQYIQCKGEDGIVNFKRVNNTLDKLQEKRGICPFCNKKINNQIYYKQNNKISWCSAVEYEAVVQCTQCGWWEHSYTFSSDDIGDGLRATSTELTQAILRSYDIDSKIVPVEVLNRYIAQNPEKIYGINKVLDS